MAEQFATYDVPVQMFGRGRSAPRRAHLVLVLLSCMLLVVAASAWLLHRSRENEWRSGGDQVHVRAQIAAVSPSEYGDIVSDLGERREPGMFGASQMIVVRVAWSGTPDEDGSYQFILLDDRVSPPKPLGGFDGSGPGGPTGPNWSGSYQSLARHYPWLAGTAELHTAQGWTSDHEALGLSAVPDGNATLSYWLPRDAIGTSSPERDLTLALAYVSRDGDVRWAKQVPLQPFA